MKKSLLCFIIVSKFIGVGLVAEESEEKPAAVSLPQRPTTIAVPSPAHSQELDYLSPGIRALRGGRWVGSDHLYNLSPNISVAVEIVKPDDLALPYSKEKLKELVEQIFRKNQITPQAAETPGSPTLPVFHVLLMIYPVEEGIVTYCSARLFEAVEVDRVALEKGTILQAITWENQNLLFSPKGELGEQATSCIESVTKAFTERFLYFETLKRRSLEEKQ